MATLVAADAAAAEYVAAAVRIPHTAYRILQRIPPLAADFFAHPTFVDGFKNIIMLGARCLEPVGPGG